MKFVKDLRTIMLVTIFFVWFSNSVNAKILWSKDLSDANTNSVPLASCLNKDGNAIIVMTVESPKGSLPIEGDNILWEIEANGNAIRIMPKKTDGSKVWTNAKPAGVGPGCAIASDSLGNLLTAGVLSKQKGEKGQKVAVISKADKSEKIMSPRNSIESHSIIKMIPLQDNTFVLVGDKNSDGLCLRIDNQGSVLQEKQFDTGRTDIFSDVDQIKPGNSNLAIVGLSVKEEGAAGMSGENFIVLYDPNFKTTHEDRFMGWRAISALSLAMLRPKVCYLDNGNIVVLYNKENVDPNDLKTRLWTRCYTHELKLLWEKEVFTADKTPLTFDIVSSDSGRFVVGIVLRSDGLEFYSFDKDGTKTDYIQYKNMIVPAGFNLMRVPGKTIAVFQEGTAGNIKECSIKAKVIALD